MGSHSDDRVQPEVIDAALYWRLADAMMALSGVPQVPDVRKQDDLPAETKDGRS
jgi:hypothetical protein